ncbi:uncharacterized protein N7511_010040 [Penicillium nucicola]|uniref:uncharacterized protein n=1 Tax=Penicillium nucicola TaxID=1850975 RepID=UPI00254585F0|nr:uncharacterized protein N7511_010040 [Penicillium nucicola]KAJ5748344.1 hypothetical protein N7511_010040 [Penicillium nucicola]
MNDTHPSTKPPEATKSNRCICCATETRGGCVACAEAPEYVPGDAQEVLYCSADCEFKDSLNHQDHCNAMKERKKLLRCAELLRDSFLAFREVLFDLSLKAITFDNGQLMLHPDERGQSDLSLRFPFPDNLTSNPAHKAAALLYCQCTAAAFMLAPMARSLLKEVCSKVEVCSLSMRSNPESRPIQTLVVGTTVRENYHTVLVVTLRLSEEQWVIDTTGGQFGHQEVIVPYKKYMDEKGSLLASPLVPYDYGLVDDLDMCRNNSPLDPYDVEGVYFMAAARDRQWFARFVDKYVRDDFLHGLDCDMRLLSEAFIAGLKDHLRRFQFNGT